MEGLQGTDAADPVSCRDVLLARGASLNARALIMSLVLLTNSFTVACDTDENPARTAPPTMQGANVMKIRLKFEGKTLTATLQDTPSARDFASLLPLTTTLADYHRTEKICDLPRKLTREGAPAGAAP